MNWVDAAVIVVVLLSGMFSMVRGFIREMLGVAAWLGAGFAAVRLYPLILPEIVSVVPAKNFQVPLAMGIVFLVVLILLSILSAWIGGLVRGSALSGLDRSLGLLFGLARGAVVVCLAYIALSVAVAQADWPAPVLQARLLPAACNGATALAALLPAPYRPNVLAVPPNPAPSADKLMQQPVSGSALGTRTE